VEVQGHVAKAAQQVLEAFALLFALVSQIEVV